MSRSVRNAIGLILFVFMVSIGVGASGLLNGGGDKVAGSSVPFNPDTATPAPTPTPKVKAEVHGLSAQAVHEGAGRIVISGVWDPEDVGSRLNVQRKESGKWADFPAGSTVGKDGKYSLWLQTGRKGDLTFRMIDPKTGDTSNPIRVKV